MRREPRQYLEDILQCIGELELTVGGFTLDTYKESSPYGVYVSASSPSSLKLSRALKQYHLICIPE
jgi:hypothetical protein